MIESSSSGLKMNVNSPIRYANDRHVYSASRIYYYTHISNTTYRYFSLSIKIVWQTSIRQYYIAWLLFYHPTINIIQSCPMKANETSSIREELTI